MFLLNSCLSLFSAAHVLGGLPLSRSYGDILPSSLTMLLPSALGFSPHPPVSVYGTGYVYAIVAFLDSHISRFTTIFRSPLRDRFFLPRLVPFACVPTVLIYISAGISTCCPSPTPLRPQLRSRLPQGRSALPWNPWIFGLRILTSISLLIPAFSLHSAPLLLSVQFLRPCECSPTDHLYP